MPWASLPAGRSRSRARGRTGAQGAGRLRRRAALAGLALALTVSPVHAAQEGGGEVADARPEDLHRMDRVRLHLRGGAVVEGTVSLVSGDVVEVQSGGERVEVGVPLILSVEVLERVEVEGSPLQPRARTRLVATPRSYGGMALSILVPGAGLLALGRPELGLPFLATDVVVLGSALASWLINQDALTAGILLGVDVSLRVSSAIASFQAGREPRLAVVVSPSPGGLVASLVFGGFGGTGGIPAGEPTFPGLRSVGR